MASLTIASNAGSTSSILNRSSLHDSHYTNHKNGENEEEEEEEQNQTMLNTHWHRLSEQSSPTTGSHLNLPEADDNDAISDIEDPHGDAELTDRDRKEFIGELRFARQASIDMTVSAKQNGYMASLYTSDQSTIDATTIPVETTITTKITTAAAANNIALPDVHVESTISHERTWSNTSVTAATSTALPHLTSIERLPNEVIVQILFLIRHRPSLYACLMVSRRFCQLTVELLWLKPSFASERQLHRMFSVLDSLLGRLKECRRLERVNLAGCRLITQDMMFAIIPRWQSLITLDLTGCKVAVVDSVIEKIAQNCRGLQNIYLGQCRQLTDESITTLANMCTKLRRINLSHCDRVTDAAICALSNNCPVLTEIDLSHCYLITDDSMLALLPTRPRLRELRVNSCLLLTDQAFSALPHLNEYMRVLDLTSCPLITDLTVQTVVARCPRLRAIDLAKCPQLTSSAVRALLPLGRSLQYLHLGHCSRITDASIFQLARHCTRLRYLDLGCCTRITDASVRELASLTRLRRLGLVRCLSITDAALNEIVRVGRATATLERIHLSYCAQLSTKAVLNLMNTCPGLNHLSVTGVPAFLHPDIQKYCREPPSEFNVLQRESFCVFSGQGVRDVRDYLNARQQKEESIREIDGAVWRSSNTTVSAIAQANVAAAMYSQNTSPISPQALAAHESLETNSTDLPANPGAGTLSTATTTTTTTGSTATANMHEQYHAEANAEAILPAPGSPQL
ncbi:hypothetical protein BDF19DRAFT_423252 [Syncephalis fuscata]|nr:hypothetical protein BDF19DRAFT_423252 [Syncephalis fuscata]